VLEIAIVACKLIKGFEPLRRMKHSENGQGTYQVLMNTQFGKSVDQTHKVPCRVTTLISRPQMVYNTNYDNASKQIYGMATTDSNEL
jgi:hypothetical protein